jgi:hypothetical protein
MEAACFSETSVDFQQGIRRCIEDDRILHNHHCKNLGTYMMMIMMIKFLHCKKKTRLEGFEVIAAVAMKGYNFRDITSCSPAKVNGRFGRTCRHHLQG